MEIKINKFTRGLIYVISHGGREYWNATNIPNTLRLSNGRVIRNRLTAKEVKIEKNRLGCFQWAF